MTKDKLNISELETLASLYNSCSMSREDERNLMRVLAGSPVSSPLLDETRALMGLESVRRQSAGRSRGRSRWRQVLGIAATACLISGVGITAFTSGNTERTTCIAYSNGKRITDTREAEKRAMEEYNESVRLIEEMRDLYRKELSESQMIINNCNQNRL